jgi:hypothetical protein
VHACNAVERAIASLRRHSYCRFAVTDLGHLAAVIGSGLLAEPRQSRHAVSLLPWRFPKIIGLIENDGSRRNRQCPAAAPADGTHNDKWRLYTTCRRMILRGFEIQACTNLPIGHRENFD